MRPQTFDFTDDVTLGLSECRDKKRSLSETHNLFIYYIRKFHLNSHISQSRQINEGGTLGNAVLHNNTE